MEKEHLEEEIDLRDYIKVIWKNRLLIVVIFMASLIASSFYSFFLLQNEYQTEATLYIKNLPKDFSDVERYNNPMVIYSTITSGNVIARTVEQSGLSEVEPFTNSKMPIESAEDWLKKNIKKDTTNIKNGMIGISIKGTLDPALMQKLLQTLISVFIEENKNKLILDAGDDINNTDIMISSLEGQKQESLKALEKTLAENSSDRVIMLERFIGLNSRLNIIESQLNQMRLSINNLEIIRSSDFKWIEVIDPPYTPDMPVGPRRMLNIAIAGVLGLFIGVLAAFFKNFMEDSA